MDAVAPAAQFASRPIHVFSRIPREARRRPEVSPAIAAAGIAERHHRPHRRGDRQVVVAQEENEREDHRGVRDDAGVALPRRRRGRAPARSAA